MMTNLKSTIFYCVLFVTLQSIFFVLAQTLHFYRPMFYLEYFIVPVVFYYQKKLLSIVLLCLIFFTEILMGMLLLLPNGGIGEVLNYFRYIRFLEWHYLIAIIIATLIFFFTCWAFLKKLNNVEKLKGILILGIVSFLINIVPNINGFLLHSYSDKRSTDIFVMGSLTQALLYYNVDRIATAYMEPVPHKYSNFYNIWNERTASDEVLLALNKEKKILFMVVESWGFPKNLNELDSQLQPFNKNPKIDIIKNLAIRPAVSTDKAEWKELCHIERFNQPWSVLKNNGIFEEVCLPSIFKKNKYKTYSYHGASREMYLRYEWYPYLQFERSDFLETVPLNKSKCSNWPGWCDVDALPHVVSNLNSDANVFQYWMTLNAHFPFEQNDFKSSVKNDCLQLNLEENSQRCNNYLINKEFFAALNTELDKQDIDDLYIVMVGDHVPPFGDKSDLNDFHSKVPLVVMKYKKNR